MFLKKTEKAKVDLIKRIICFIKILLINSIVNKMNIRVILGNIMNN